MTTIPTAMPPPQISQKFSIVSGSLLSTFMLKMLAKAVSGRKSAARRFKR